MWAVHSCIVCGVVALTLLIKNTAHCEEQEASMSTYLFLCCSPGDLLVYYWKQLGGQLIINYRRQLTKWDVHCSIHRRSASICMAIFLFVSRDHLLLWMIKGQYKGACWENCFLFVDCLVVQSCLSAVPMY